MKPEALVPAVVILPHVDHEEMSPGAWMPILHHSLEAQRWASAFYVVIFQQPSLL
jgi:hypothetical protein